MLFRSFLIATGSEWHVPEIPGLESTPHHTPKTIFSLARPPKTLFIIGSGIEAWELAHLFSTLGTKIYLAEASKQILVGFDNEASRLIIDDTKENRGINILIQTEVIAVQKSGLQKRVTFVQGRAERSVRVDEILIASERRPATDLGLENAGIKYTRAARPPRTGRDRED